MRNSNNLQPQQRQQRHLRPQMLAPLEAASQTVTPLVEALMTPLAKVHPNHRVLKLFSRVTRLYPMGKQNLGSQQLLATVVQAVKAVQLVRSLPRLMSKPNHLILLRRVKLCIASSIL